MDAREARERQPTNVGQVLETLGRNFKEEEGRVAKDPRFRQVAAKLLDQFGEGDNVTLRRELYDRCERACQQHGEVCYRIVVGAVRSSKTAREPGRYFSATVSRRMREAGFFGDEYSLEF